MKLLAIFGLASIAAIMAQTPAQTAAPPKPRPAKATAVTPAPLEVGLYTTITTSMGPVILKLYEKESPITVKNFMELAQGKKEWTDPKTRQRVKRPLYNGLIFHRVIPGFMIQGGDPQGNGMGGTDEIPDEFAPSLTFDRAGRLAMANAGPRTGSSQFFITEGPTTHLNGRHTIFGQVIQGQTVVSRIANTPKGEDDKPRTPVRILRVTFQRVGPGAQPGPAASKPKSSSAKPKPASAKPLVVKPAPAKAKPQSSGTSK